MRPRDCKDLNDAIKLKEQGVGYNDDKIRVEPNVVIMKIGQTTIRIPMSRFRMFAEWYLTDQKL